MRAGLLPKFVFTLTFFAVSLPGQPVAGVKWTAPSGWTSKGSAPMRAATYTVQDAECIVYFFGSGQGGTAEANLARWKSQFTVSGAPAPAHVESRTIHGMKVTSLDVAGTYTATGGAAMTSQEPRSGTRMLAAIVEAPGGNLFVKFTGPAAVITAQKTSFEELLNSFTKN